MTCEPNTMKLGREILREELELHQEVDAVVHELEGVAVLT